MRRITRTLAGLYAVLAIGLGYCAVIAFQHDSWGYTMAFAATSFGYVLAIAHHEWLLDEYRQLLARVDRPALPTRQRRSRRGAVALDNDCCERWWTSLGAEHDPTTCTRKDQTT